MVKMMSLRDDAMAELNNNKKISVLKRTNSEHTIITKKNWHLSQLNKRSDDDNRTWEKSLP